MNDITVYSTPTCPYCVMAKKLLTNKGLDYTEINVSQDLAKREEMNRLSDKRTVPQIVIDGKHIGGYTDLVAHFSGLD